MSILLLIPSSGYTCFDDYDDWSDDDWYDDWYEDLYDYLYDYGSYGYDDYDDLSVDNQVYPDEEGTGGFGIGIVGDTSNDDDEYDDDWWRTDYSSDEEYDDNTDWDEDNDYELDNNNNNSNNNSNNSNNEYKIKDKDKVVNNLPDNWKKQDSNMNCVSTAMELVSRIILESGCIDRSTFEYGYDEKYNIDLREEGVKSNNLNDFVNIYFETSNIKTYEEFENAIDNNHPIMVTVESEDGNNDHEVVVVGFVDDEDNDENKYNGEDTIIFDPGYGNYHTIPFSDIKPNSGIEISDLNTNN